jgi:Na+-translocating ferredoxin:NAD+ oxidoreductase RNF subunit RnfB
MAIETTILNSVLILGGLGFVTGAIISFAEKKLAEKNGFGGKGEDALLELLPGVDCGACGYKTCNGYAAALSKGEAFPGHCTIISDRDNDRLSALLGKQSEPMEKTVAVVLCGGGKNCKDKMDYRGIKNCSIAMSVFGGNKECEYGCLGLGDCVKACEFGAIRVDTATNLPIVDMHKCTSCGACVKACPQSLIRIVPCRFKHHILCRSFDRGADVSKICPAGCIGCGICVRSCPERDITIDNNLASMKYKKCDNCAICFHKCPTKTIVGPAI